MPISYSLNTYSGAWTKADAGHLLRRSMFGPTNQQISDAVANGMSNTITSLLTIPTIGKPLTYHPDETIAGFGTTWVDSVYPSSTAEATEVNTARLFSLASWMMERINNESLSIAEKMCLFWHNHFGATPGADARGTYDYHILMRTHALGDFKQLVKDMTIDPNMLQFLNGASNSVFSPNENFARELLELFTIGKGPQIGPGDYSNYTEADISESAKVLTGFHVSGIWSPTQTDLQPVFTPSRHDSSTKTLSSHFGNTTISPNGANEYEDLIDIIFQQTEVSRFICRKLYRYFVNFEINQDVEDNIIAGLASTLRANNYSIQPVMSQLLSSEHFYDLGIRGSLIKGPLDFAFSLLNGTESTPDYPLETKYGMLLTMYNICTVMGQAYGNPPSVAGWPAYYQEPTYSKLWVNSTHIKTRFDLSILLTTYTGIEVDGEHWKINSLDFVDNLSSPASAPDVIQDMVDVFLPKGATTAQKDTLRLILTDGLPDFEWTIQYNDYLSNPGDPSYSDPVKARIEATLATLFQLPEFQTM